MNSIVIYDSNYGNTKIIAGAIAKELSAKAVPVSAAKPDELKNYDLVVFGSPIIGWKPSEKMGGFLASLKSGQLENIKAATFDTRVKLFIHGDAAGKIAGALKKAGAHIIAKPAGFFVKGKEGPLLEGEVDKAVEWARQLKTK